MPSPDLHPNLQPAWDFFTRYTDFRYLHLHRSVLKGYQITPSGSTERIMLPAQCEQRRSRSELTMDGDCLKVDFRLPVLEQGQVCRWVSDPLILPPDADYSIVDYVFILHHEGLPALILIAV